MPHPYITLNVTEQASSAEIRQAYLKLIKRYPPETSPSEYQEINQAYSAIKDEYNRARLTVFGNLSETGPLSDMIPTRSSKRSRAGIQTWLSYLQNRRK